MHVGLVLIIGSSSSQGVPPAITISQYLVYYLSNINRRNNCDWANDAPIKQVKEIEIFVFAKTKHLLCGFEMVVDLRNKKAVPVCTFLARIGVFISTLHIGQSLEVQENRNNQSMEFTWRFGDFNAEQGKYSWTLGLFL